MIATAIGTAVLSATVTLTSHGVTIPDSPLPNTPYVALQDNMDMYRYQYDVLCPQTVNPAECRWNAYYSYVVLLNK